MHDDPGADRHKQVRNEALDGRPLTLRSAEQSRPPDAAFAPQAVHHQVKKMAGAGLPVLVTFDTPEEPHQQKDILRIDVVSDDTRSSSNELMAAATDPFPSSDNLLNMTEWIAPASPSLVRP